MGGHIGFSSYRDTNSVGGLEGEGRGMLDKCHRAIYRRMKVVQGWTLGALTARCGHAAG